jgi:oxygen-independent coproporphyrinogen-3 oxidase
VRKCPYCDFNSHQAPPLVPQDQYVDALLEDLELDAAAASGRRVASVFFGGGTPSLFSPEEIARFLAGARARIEFSVDAEITLEANPGTIEHGRFSGYRDAGVNRISLGVQSFSDVHLQALGRIHGAAEIARSVDELRAARLDNFNLDLMYGLPGQTMAMARADIEAATRTAVPHISAYQLTLEPNTVFWSKPPKLPAHDDCADMQARIEEALSQAGYEHYETSAFAKPRQRCRHNLNYWEFGDYLGIGAGAHGKISFLDRITRHERIKQPREYLSAASAVSERVVPACELPFEFMLNALRLVEGFAVALYEERSGLPLTSIQKQLEKAEQAGLLERDWKRVRPTVRGQRFLNELLELFLSDETPGRAPDVPAAFRVIRTS